MFDVPVTLKSWSRSSIIEVIRELHIMHLWYDFRVNATNKSRYRVHEEMLTAGRTDGWTDGRTDGQTDGQVNLIGGLVPRNPPKNSLVNPHVSFYFLLGE